MTARDPRGQPKRSESRQRSCWRLFLRPFVTGFAGELRVASLRVGYGLRPFVTPCGRGLPASPVCYGLAAVCYRLRRWVTRRFAPRGLRPGGRVLPASPVCYGLAAVCYRLRRLVTRRFAPRGLRPAAVCYRLRQCVTAWRPFVTGFAGWLRVASLGVGYRLCRLSPTGQRKPGRSDCAPGLRCES
jgi:hypothetical protein